MSATRSQRIGIWIIAVVMAVGTIGSFFVVILANDNAQNDQKAAQESYQKMLEEARKSNKPLDGFEATAFDKGSITELKTEVVKQGEGAEVKADSTISANYFGWTADGAIFDSTNQDGTTTPREFSLAQVIKGWTEGLAGQKVGSTVKLSIPADKAYGDVDTGTGQPTGPLVFIVEIKELK